MPEVQGLGRREETRGPDISALANQPSRQLAQSGVRAPSRANVSQVGAGYRVLAEVAKLGGATMDKFLRDKEAADFTEGQMQYVEGATLDELQTAGFSRAAVSGYRVLDAQSGLNNFSAQQTANIQAKDRELDPQTYQAQLGDEISAFRSALPDDEAVGRFADAAVLEMSDKLVREHTIQNADFIRSEAARSVSELLQSTDEAGNTEVLGNYLNNLDAFPGTDTAVRAAVSSAMAVRFSEGSTSMWDALGGTKGMRKRGFSEEQISAASKQFKTTQVSNETSFASDIEDFERDFKQRLIAGESPEVLIKDAEYFTKEYNLSPDFYNTLYSKVSAQISLTGATSEELDVVFNPELKQDVSELLASTRATGMSTATRGKLDSILNEHAVPKRLQDPLVKAITGAADEYNTDKAAARQKLIQEQAKQDKLDSDATAFANGGFTSAVPSKVQQRASKLGIAAIVAGVASDESIGDGDKPHVATRRTVDFLTKLPFKSEEVKNNLTIAGQQDPVDPNTGEASVGAKEAMMTYDAMREAGFSKANISEYFGDSYNMFSTASVLANGSPSVTQALLLSKEMFSEDKQFTPRVSRSTFDTAFVERSEKFFDKLDKSWFNSDGTGSDYSDITTAGVRRAATNNQDLRNFVTDKAAMYSSIYPGMGEAALLELAFDDAGQQFSYVNGVLVKPHRGRSFEQVLGIQDLPGDMKGNVAALVYMDAVSDTAFPEGSAERGVWDGIKKSVGDMVKDTGNAAITFRTAAQRKAFKEGKTSGTRFNLLAFVDAVQAAENNILPFDTRIIANNAVLITLYESNARLKVVGSIQAAGNTMGNVYKEAVDFTGISAAPQR